MKHNTRKKKHQQKNVNRIVRIDHNKIHHMIQSVAYQLGCPYQLVFSEFLIYIGEGYTFGYNTGDMLVRRILERYTDNSE